jgi:hypothetical protein
MAKIRRSVRPKSMLHRHKRVKITHFTHKAKFGRPTAAKIEGLSLGDLASASESDEMTKEMLEYLRKAGEIIANYCRIQADKFSTRIPMSLSVKNDEKTVYILGGGPPAPNAYPFDPPTAPPVWHPVFPSGPRRYWNWAPQPYRPFLEEGAELGGDEAAEAFADIIDQWASEIGSDRP